MAICKKNYMTTFGVTAEHWVIQSINTNAHYGWADILLAGYVNEKVYTDGSDPIAQHRVKINTDTGFDTYLGKKSARSKFSNMNIYELAYNIVKEDNFFKDSKDV